jgi:integrase
MVAIARVGVMAKRINFIIEAIKGLRPPATGVNYYYDANKSAPPGFGLWVTAGGAKTFMLYRKVHGRPERIKVGRFSDLSIEQARKLAEIYIGEIATGGNPNDKKRTARGELTLGALFAEYIERHAKVQTKRWREAEADFRRYLSSWAPRKPSTLTRDDVQRWHASLGTKRGRYVANRALQLLRAVINWGVATRLIHRRQLQEGENPASGQKLFNEKKRERFIQKDEMPCFFLALADEPNDNLRDYVLLSLLTGARKTNVLEMRWKQINFARGVWGIPETKNGESQTVPLTAEALDILSRRRDRTDGDYVFPGHGTTGHFREPKRGWQRILKRAGIADLRIHDLRRTLGSWQAATGASLSVIGKTLNHKDASTTAIYARLDIDPVRESVEKATSAMLTAAGLKPRSALLRMKP